MSTSPPKPPSGQGPRPPRPTRAERLAAALRANLKRRKAAVPPPARPPAKPAS